MMVLSTGSISIRVAHPPGACGRRETVHLSRETSPLGAAPTLSSCAHRTRPLLYPFGVENMIRSTAFGLKAWQTSSVPGRVSPCRR